MIRWTNGCLTVSMVIAALMEAAPAARAQSWSNCQLLNETWEAGMDVKNATVVAAPNGGFHATYEAGQLKYRRYFGGVLKPSQGQSVPNFWANLHFCLGLDGRVHMVIEDWAFGGPEVRWYRWDVNDATGQLFNGINQVLSSSSASAKYPYIVPVGTGAGGDVVMTYTRFRDGIPTNKQIFSNRFNGSAWSGESSTGSYANSAYEVHGIARSPVDGTVYRAFTDAGTLKLRRYNGLWWEGEIVLDSVVRNGDSMHNRQSVGVNGAGQVMVVWDQGGRFYSVIYTPGVGVGGVVELTSNGSWGTSCTGIPGTNRFYSIYSADTATHMVGRLWSGGAWQGDEHVSAGLANNFMVDPSVSAGPDGTLYAVFEYWGSGKPQQYYTIKAPPSPGTTGTLAGTVRDQYGQPVTGAGINTSGTAGGGSGPGGTYSFASPTGTYSLTAAKTHYVGQTINGRTVAAGQTTVTDFVLTGQPPAPATMLRVIPGNTQARVEWTNPWSAQVNGARVVARVGADPTGPDDGVVVIDDVAPPGALRSVLHTGLTNGLAYHYKVYAYFQDSSRFYAAGSAGSFSGIPAVRPDFDRDGDVDQQDFGLLQSCFSGRDITQNREECQPARLDADDDVDGDDLAIFMGCAGGANQYAPPNCAG